MTNPITKATDHLIALQMERLAWIEPLAAKVSKWREEDEAIGIHWNTREAGVPNKQPASNSNG